ncbi:amino acid ABC transporter, partial [Rhizobiaceae bacterium]|nr:amino acid ABC transporter [Rhizobiaceae bacterium]
MRPLLALLVLLTAGMAAPADAQSPDTSATPVIPNFFDPQVRIPRPDLSGRERLRFLTVTDFPPFSFIGTGDRLTGF